MLLILEMCIPFTVHVPAALHIAYHSLDQSIQCLLGTLCDSFETADLIYPIHQSPIMFASTKYVCIMFMLALACFHTNSFMHQFVRELNFETTLVASVILFTEFGARASAHPTRKSTFCMVWSTL